MFRVVAPGLVRPKQSEWWNAVANHPRLVFDNIGPTEEQIILYYLATGRPFTVVTGEDS